MRPDIVFITAHDVGRHLGCYGVDEVRSVNLDRLAGDGVRFSNFFSVAPQCSPSRAAYMTGRYPHETGVLGICSSAFGFDLVPSVRHLSDNLKEAGYRTCGLGEVHETLEPARYFDDYRPAAGRGVVAGATEELVAGACSAVLAERAKEEPLYLQIGFREAHRPFAVESVGSVDAPPPAWLADEPSARTELARFRGSIAKLDWGVGTILDAVEQSRRAANTLVVFVSDHGIPFPRAKHTLYEAGCEAAAIVRWPDRGWTGGRTLDSLASGVDLLPTLLEALGIEVPNALPGVSFCASLDGTGSSARNELYTEQNYHVYLDASRAIRTERFKLIANFSPGRSFFDSSQSWRPATRVAFVEDSARTLHPPVELYDLREDPLEERNLVEEGKWAGVLAELRGKLLSWMEETDDPLLTGLPEPPTRRRTLDILRSPNEEQQQ